MGVSLRGLETQGQKLYDVVVIIVRNRLENKASSFVSSMQMAWRCYTNPNFPFRVTESLGLVKNLRERYLKRTNGILFVVNENLKCLDYDERLA